MTTTLHSVSVPVFKRVLSNLSHCLEKAKASAKARNFDVNVLMGYRLAPDMFAFARQVQIACDAAKLCCARVSGSQAPKFEDNEITFDQLKTRIANTLAYIETIKPSDINGKESLEITFPVGPEKTRTLSAEDFVRYWATPNLYFHTSMAYAILRHNGVDVGKLDFLLGSLR